MLEDSWLPGWRAHSQVRVDAATALLPSGVGAGRARLEEEKGRASRVVR